MCVMVSRTPPPDIRRGQQQLIITATPVKRRGRRVVLKFPTDQGPPL